MVNGQLHEDQTELINTKVNVEVSWVCNEQVRCFNDVIVETWMKVGNWQL